MTLEERLNAIQKESNLREQEQQEKEQQEKNDYVESMDKLVALSQRIKDILKVANECLKNGIQLPYPASDYGYHQDDCLYTPKISGFVSNGWSHWVGFMGRGIRNHYSYLGFYNGGACGSYDFYTNGDVPFEISHNEDAENSNAQRYKPQKKHIDHFVDRFNHFEECFYKWVDSLGKR